MIILLDDGVAADEAIVRPATSCAVEALYSAMGRGEHYVLAPRAVLHKILIQNSNSLNVKAILNWSVQNYSFLAGLTQVIPASMVVVADGPTKKLDESMWQTSVEEVARAGVRPVVLLAENSVDAEIYKHAAHHFLLSKKLGSMNLSVEERNGNGSGIATELENLVKRRSEWCLCIPDSDRRCPEGSIGINAQQCAAVAAKAAWPVTLMSTSGRELENDVPRTALDLVASIRVPSWREQTQLVAERCGTDILTYADIKKGTRPCHLQHFPVGTKEHGYWEAANVQYAGALPKGEACPDNGGCGDRRGCALLPPVGEGVGTAVLAMFGSESSHASYKQHKSSVNFDTWLDLGRTVATHGLSPKRMRL